MVNEGFFTWGMTLSSVASSQPIQPATNSTSPDERSQRVGKLHVLVDKNNLAATSPAANAAPNNACSLTQ